MEAKEAAAGPMAKLRAGVSMMSATTTTSDKQLRRRQCSDAAVLLRQALAEDNSLAMAHFTLGFALQVGEADVDGAEAAYRAAMSVIQK